LTLGRECASIASRVAVSSPTCPRMGASQWRSRPFARRLRAVGLAFAQADLRIDAAAKRADERFALTSVRWPCHADAEPE
jgi:hypothetical protein